jgi:hypothetical protein
MTEYEEEPIRGLPGYLPAGEQIVWQGEPQWRALSRRVFHTRKVALYFGVLMLASAAQRITAGQSLPEIAGSVAWQFALGAVSVGILTLLAWLYARSTVYTITNRRIVMRFGVALPMMVNIPWDRIESAAFRSFADGNGDIALTPTAKGRVSYWTIWPHARPWRFSPVQPSLRGIDDAARVAELISGAVAGQPAAQTGRDEQADWSHGATATA